MRFCSDWRLKTVSSIAFMIVFFAGYFSLLKFPVFPATTMPQLGLDRLIPFTPQALGWYVSLWFYVEVPVALLRTREEVFAYGKAVALLALTGFAVFFFWPTRLIPAYIDPVSHPAFGFLQGIDASGNACPSLHVAFAVFSAMAIERSLEAIRAPLAIQFVNTGWCLGIIYSTLATRQHVSLDVGAGIGLAVFVRTLLRYFQKRSADRGALPSPVGVREMKI